MTESDPNVHSATTHPFASTVRHFQFGKARSGRLYSLPALAEQFPQIDRLPVSLRIMLESLLRHCGEPGVTPEHVAQLAQWQPVSTEPRSLEIPFPVARVVLQDFTGVPLLADLAAMRDVATGLGLPAKNIEPLVPVDLVVDHSVMIDHYGSADALDLNMKLEFQRNRERYQFMKWGMQAFDTFRVVPPGFGIVHQVNLEYLARGVHKSGPKDADGAKLYYPDSLVGTDSHTTMINGIGVVGWGVGGIEAEAAMLGQPVYVLTPDVVGFELRGELREGVTATDLVLSVTEILRREKVVGQFVEFYGPGVARLSVPDRATIANMAPEYGATMGFFPVDEKTLDYFRGTGRTGREIAAFEAYFRAQGLFGIPGTPEASPQLQQIEYTRRIVLDLGQVTPSLAGPKRPQDRIEITHLSRRFAELFSSTDSASGFNQPAEKLTQSFPARSGLALRNGDVLIAAITSCTNTSNPSVMLAAGLLAKKAVEAGLRVPAHIKTSLAPGSRIVTEYLQVTGLLPYLEQLGFNVAAYGCTTCIGNAGDLTAEINETITANQLICAAVLSGNRNFEARIHPNLKANFLASPPLVLAYALAGNVQVDLMTEPVGRNSEGRDIFLGDIWPHSEEVQALLSQAMNPKAFRRNYEQVQSKPGKLWKQIEGVVGDSYNWPASSYIARPPFFTGFALPAPEVSDGQASIQGARIMALFGDSITTDHISPAGSIKASSPAGLYLQEQGIKAVDFNSYGSRRGHHEVMMRGTFANVRIKNLMLPPGPDGQRVEGGLTLLQPSGEAHPIYDAAMSYLKAGVPTVIFAGEEYGTGSSRDWAAKGTALLGIKAVVARSFERIHRANLVGMGVLPLQFMPGDSWQSLGLRGDELIDLVIEGELLPQRPVQLRIHSSSGDVCICTVLLRIDTPIEVSYYRHGGILPYVLRGLLAS
ncbi:aconitate hydratase AcnA [Paucibacter sp. DJ1R-11]|uniref:aconitate hydratase AcnA n=1 Tax=Paucibacter sp. DJ1R-11 TaxID=2893556 RepID=UPI0021E3C447|nr:aconitate hydratase AcnA [Paucibacter sp. DJ1R-11]MCV2363951.1 aconitate hydratase AcnA [Paucibacter sp. DJ1R-11]